MSDDAGNEKEGSDESSEGDSLYDGLAGILLLPFAPRPALELLFSRPWPRFAVTLLFSYALLPLVLNIVLPPTAGLGHLFITLNKQYPITPTEFTRICYFGSVLGLPLMIVGLSLLQGVMLLLQRERVSLIVGIAGLTYSAWPLFVVSLLRQLLLFWTNEHAMGAIGLTTQNPVSQLLVPISGFLIMFLQILLLVAAGWGVWIWMRFIQGVTDLGPERIIATCVVVGSVPAITILALIASYLLSMNSQTVDFGVSVPDLEQLRHSLIYHPD